jgi:diaminopimelate decarboxylase
MTDNPRLALYGAKYEAILANRALDKCEGTWAVAGKCCESGDMIIWDQTLPDPRPGDILAVFCTGAYNFSMASHYNRIPHPAVLFVRDGDVKVVVERETWEDVVRLDRPLHSIAARDSESVRPIASSVVQS